MEAISQQNKTEWITLRAFYGLKLLKQKRVHESYFWFDFIIIQHWKQSVLLNFKLEFRYEINPTKQVRWIEKENKKVAMESINQDNQLNQIKAISN